MTNMIDINNLSKYEENNHIEVKRAKGGLPKASGKPMLLLPIRIHNWNSKRNCMSNA